MIVLLMFLFRTGIYAQGPFAVANKTRIDSLIKARQICNGNLIFPPVHKKAWVRKDLATLGLINESFGELSTNDRATMRIKQVFNRNLLFANDNGLLRSEQYVFRGKYLKLTINIGSIGDIKVSEQICIETNTYGQCDAVSAVMDFSFITKYMLPRFPYILMVDQEELSFDTVYTGSIQNLQTRYPDYRFLVPTGLESAWLNQLLTNQFLANNDWSYSAVKAPRQFVQLVRENKITYLQGLLFSPNYLVSINAMEALVYLASNKNMELSSGEQKQIDRLLKQSVRFKKQMSDDFFINIDNYEEMKMSKEDIIRKYQNSM